MFELISFNSSSSDLTAAQATASIEEQTVHQALDDLEIDSDDLFEDFDSVSDHDDEEEEEVIEEVRDFPNLLLKVKFELVRERPITR